MSENDSLQTAMNQTERDTIEVITFLKKKDAQKDEEVASLKSTIRELRQGAWKEWEEKESEYQQRISNLEADLLKKEQEVSAHTDRVH